MHEAVVAILLADVAVAALVGNRVKWGGPPELGAGLPAVTLTDVSGGPIYTLDGNSGRYQGRVQIDVWAVDKAAAKAAGKAVQAAIETYSGAIGGVTVKTAFFDQMRLLEEYTDRGRGSDGQASVGRWQADLMIGWQE